MTSNVDSAKKTPITTTGHVLGASFGLVFVLANSGPLLLALRIVVDIAAVALFLVIVARFVQTRHATPRDEAEDTVVGFTGR